MAIVSCFLLALLYLLPGLLAVLLLRPPERASTWLALATPVAVAIQIGIECALKAFVRPLHAEPRVLAALVVSIALFACVTGFRRKAPLRTAADWRAILFAVAVPVVFLVAFREAIVDREPTSDGAEAIEMARQLDAHLLPRWPTESGLKGFGQGLIALAFPNAWFGHVEFGTRITFLMFLGVIVAQVLALVEYGGTSRAGWRAAAAIAIAVLATGCTLGLHVSFDPYFADPANPAGAELMTVAMMLAAFVALIEGRTGVLLIAAVLAHATLPSGLLFLAVLGAAHFALTRSRPALARIGGAIALCVAVTLLYEKVYVPLAIEPGTTLETGAESLAGRVRLLIFHDFSRLAFLVIPSGILPAFFLFGWRTQDHVARIATLVTTALFLFFFVLATYSPHYFAPVMVLALVPFWRSCVGARAPRWLAWSGLAGAVAGLTLSLPPFHGVPQPCRAIGEKISIDVVIDPARIRDFRPAAGVLQSLAHLPWDEVDPARSLVASGLQLAHAAAWFEKSGHGIWIRDWEVLPDVVPPEDGYQPVVSRGGWTLLARPGVRIEDVRDKGWRTDFQAPWYRVPKEALFRGLTEKSRRYDLDLRALFRRS